jgi:hypothetical protein
LLELSIDFNGGMRVRIHSDTITKQFFQARSDYLLFFIELINNVLQSPEFGDSHLIFGESTSFVTADVVGSTHSLAG